MSPTWTLLLLAKSAFAADVAVIVGARSNHDPRCTAAPALADASNRSSPGMDCRELSFSDDDAWRVAWALRTRYPPERILVFTDRDESSAHLEYPGGEPLSPDSQRIAERVSELSQTLGEPLHLGVYVAAHGNLDGLDLADRRLAFPTFREMLLEASGGGRIDLLVADSCLSAHWRGAVSQPGPVPSYLPVSPSPWGYVEASVNGLIPEMPELRGGVFTHLFLSGLLGGADDDTDGLVRVQELSDFVRSTRATTNLTFDPVFRSPSGDPLRPVLAPGGKEPSSSLTLKAAENAERYIVSVLAGEGAVLLAELFLRPSEVRTLHLPPGDYRVVRVPYGSIDERMLQVPLTPTADRCRIRLEAGAAMGFSGCAVEPILLARNRGSETPAIEDAEIESLLSALPFPSLRESEPLARRYHGGNTWALQAGLALSDARLERDAQVLGMSIALTRALFGGRAELATRLEFLPEIAPREPSTGSSLSLRPGIDLLLGGSATSRLGLAIEAGPSLFLVFPKDMDQAPPALSSGASAFFGPSWSWSAGAWGLRASAGWQPWFLGLREALSPTSAHFETHSRLHGDIGSWEGRVLVRLPPR